MIFTGFYELLDDCRIAKGLQDWTLLDVHDPLSSSFNPSTKSSDWIAEDCRGIKDCPQVGHRHVDYRICGLPQDCRIVQDWTGLYSLLVPIILPPILLTGLRLIAT